MLCPDGLLRKPCDEQALSSANGPRDCDWDGARLAGSLGRRDVRQNGRQHRGRQLREHQHPDGRERPGAWQPRHFFRYGRSGHVIRLRRQRGGGRHAYCERHYKLDSQHPFDVVGVANQSSSNYHTLTGQLQASDSSNTVNFVAAAN
jgi:hypothetical protein